MAERQGNNNAGVAVERVTIAEAAALLGCHPNTVRSRVKAGWYRAEKVHTENGLTWMIDRDSLTTNTPPSARQQAVSVVPALQQAALQEMAKAIVKEAGLVPDPEAEAEKQRIEDLMDAYKRHTQAYLDALKHLTTLSGASILAAVAIIGAFFKDSPISLLLYLSLGMMAWAMIRAGFIFARASRWVGVQTMDGTFWRDQTVDEFLEVTRSFYRSTRLELLHISYVWATGFLSFLLGASIAWLYLTSPF